MNNSPTTKSIYVFYGFSGDPGKTPNFPNGRDNDRSLDLAAETLKDTLAALYPADRIYVLQAWSKNVIVDTLAKAPEKIRQVHIACHGDSTMLSLAYRFAQGKRLKERAKKFNTSTTPSRDLAIKAMKEEDALVAGFFTYAIDQATLRKIKDNHAEKAAWQIWGCYCGYPNDSFTGLGDAVIDPYLKRFNLGNLKLPGIAVEIAKTLGVTCTAAKGGAGMSFWHGETGKKVIRNSNSTPAKKPFWLWNTKGSTWVTYDASGKQLPRPLIFQVPREKVDLPTPQPPTWLTQAGIMATGLSVGRPGKSRAPLGKSMSAFFETAQAPQPESVKGAAEFSSGMSDAIPPPPDFVNPRSAWGAIQVGTIGSKHSPRLITVHHTDTPNNDRLAIEERLRQIQNHHINTKKWKDIGYHFLVSPDGRIWQGRENMERTGAHVFDHNQDNLGIGFLGNFQSTSVPQAMLDGAARLVSWLCTRYGIIPNRDNIKGHREWAATTCPGDFLMARLSDLVGAIQPPATAESLSFRPCRADLGPDLPAATGSPDPHLGFIRSLSGESSEEDDASWDFEDRPAPDPQPSSDTEDLAIGSVSPSGTAGTDVPLSEAELNDEMSSFLATMGLSETEEEEDFQEHLRQAAQGKYRKPGEGESSESTPSATADGKREAKHLSHDIFDHMGPDLAHATTYDLGRHDIDRRLDTFAMEIISEPEKPKLPLAADRKRTRAAELDDMDLLSSLALIDKAPASAHGTTPQPEAPGKDIPVGDASVTGEPASDDTPAPRQDAEAGQDIPTPTNVEINVQEARP